MIPKPQNPQKWMQNLKNCVVCNRPNVWLLSVLKHTAEVPGMIMVQQCHETKSLNIGTKQSALERPRSYVGFFLGGEVGEVIL